MKLSWEEQLQSAIFEKWGKTKGRELINNYSDVFNLCYKNKFSIEFVLQDLCIIKKLSAVNELETHFYTDSKDETPLHLRLFLQQKPIPLSDLLPILDNLNLRVYSLQTKQIQFEKTNLWIFDFAISYKGENLKTEELSLIFKEAFKMIYYGFSENDGFNKLILTAGLQWREVMVLRAYAKYLHQINFRYPQVFIEKTLVKNISLAKSMVEFFKFKHDPTLRKKKPTKNFEKEISVQLEEVSSLDEDRVLRSIFDLMKATLRTNYFQKKNDKSPKGYLSLKLFSKDVPGIPLPVPLYEIYVYSHSFEGIHLRNMKVARGGIRWSERPEDFRTEILGLMKAQKVKNAVIVPSGAKGGFVLKTAPEGREALQAEVVSCYKLFISGLLDLTDNIKEQKIIAPKNVVCLDDADPYLVVAADKGTAAFSDLANSLAKAYDFWLGDAFASGGTKGYDHKKMGITARGAWESIKRHFHELNIDLTKTDITVVGIGDMSGDVFGNGMLYSKHIKLVAAFDHRDIFIDPEPDPLKSYKERARLFQLASSSWEDYNPSLISTGGGVFKRSLKSIPLSPQIKKLLKLKSNSLSPEELIKEILKAPVQLLFNGGIGTYVKAKTENNFEVADRANDWCRVNGEELRCKVVGEGGNLGFTQLGRVEYALKGGLINTDFIDNSAGVDCSDHEVNLKILLDSEVRKGKLTEKNRDKLLTEATDEVAQLVLKDNYNHALLLSFSAFHAVKNSGLHAEYIKYLETKEIIDRENYFLPNEKEILERKAAEIGLTRPELAILIAYTKIDIKNEILNSSLPENCYMKRLIETAFPSSIDKKFHKSMDNHRLQREIIATQLSNQIVNEMGITFFFRMQRETGAKINEIACAQMLASRIFRSYELTQLIDSLGYKMALNMQYEMFANIRNLINISTRWFLHSGHMQEDLGSVINHFSVHIDTLEKVTPSLMGGFTKQYLEVLTKQFSTWGLPIEIAGRIAAYRAIYSALNIIEVATNYQFDLIKTAKVYYKVGERFNLLWFRDQIGLDSREGHWNALSRLTIRDELNIAQCELTAEVLKSDKEESDVNCLIENWISKNQETFGRWDSLLAGLHSTTDVDYSMIFIAMRELLNMITLRKNN